VSTVAKQRVVPGTGAEAVQQVVFLYAHCHALGLSITRDSSMNGKGKRDREGL
jgi:hypothetical protein